MTLIKQMTLMKTMTLMKKNDIPENTKDNIIQSLQSISETKTENIKEM